MTCERRPLNPRPVNNNRGALRIGRPHTRFDQMGPVIQGRDRFLLAREWWPYFAGAGFAMAASSVAAFIPARRASLLNPVEIVRGAA